MYVERITLIEVSNLAEQYRYPFTMQVNNEQLRNAEDTYYRRGELSTAATVDIFGSSVSHDADVHEVIDIVNGWDDARYRVLVEVVAEKPNTYRSGRRYVLCGYTDRIDFIDTKGGEIDIAEDTAIYLNSIITIRDDLVGEGGRSRVRSRVMANNQILSGRYEPNGDSEYVYRPQEVFTTMGFEDEFGSDDDTTDTRIQFCTGVLQSRRTNGIGSNYISKLIDADIDAARDGSVYGSDSDMFGRSRISSCESFSSEQMLLGNPVLAALSNVGDDLDIDGFVRYDDLAVLNDDQKSSNYELSLDALSDVTEVVPMTDENFDYHSESMNGAFEETLIAVKLANAIPAIMSELALGTISFNCTNANSLDGTMEYDIVDSAMVVHGVDNLSLLEDVFLKRVETDVIKHITSNNELVLTLEVDSEVAGMTDITIAIGSGESFSYSIPSFADSNLSPVITEDLRNVKKLVTSFRGVSTAINRIITEDEDDVEDERSSRRRNRDNSTNTRSGLLDLNSL